MSTSAITATTPTAVALVLLHSICVAQRVERVLAVGVGGGDAGHHAGAGLLAYKGILQHLSELAASEGSVAVLALQRADHLLERQQRGVDLRPLHARLLGVVRRIGAALAARQVNKAQLSANRSLVGARSSGGRHNQDIAAVASARPVAHGGGWLGLAQENLHHLVGAAALGVGAGGACGALPVRHRHQLQQLAHILDQVLREAGQLHLFEW